MAAYVVATSGNYPTIGHIPIVHLLSHFLRRLDSITAVSVQPDTMTLSGYDDIWSVTDIHRTAKFHLPRKLDAMTKAAENYGQLKIFLICLSAGLELRS